MPVAIHGAGNLENDMAKANQSTAKAVAASTQADPGQAVAPDQGVSAETVDATLPPEAPAAAQDAGETVKVRVLVQSEFGPTNAVVTLPVAVAEAAQRANQVDADPAAVAYAESL